MIEVVSASVVVGKAVLLDDVSLTVRPGQLLAVVGPNGAGKSTLLSLLSGDRRPSSGTVTIDGEPSREIGLDRLALVRAVLGQDLPAAIPFSVEALVEMGRHPHRHVEGGSAEHDREVVSSAIAAVGLAGFERRVVASLSAGERLRAHFARVLAQETPVVLLDEPTASLDVAHQEQVLGLCADLVSRRSAVVGVLHDLNAAAAYADRVVIIDGGRVRADGVPDEVLDEELLSDVYRQPLRVVDHPFRDCRLVMVVDR